MQFTIFALAALSIGSTSAATVPQPNVLLTAVDAASDAKAAVDTEVAIIQKAVDDTVNNEVIPAVNASIANIKVELENLKDTVVPIIEDIVLPLVASELALLPDLINDAQYIVSEIRDSFSLVLAELSDDLLVVMKTEVELVIAIIEPFVTPIVSFANEATKDLSGTSITNIKDAVQILKTDLADILGPIKTAFDQIY
ncbi:hypothetical protein GGR57DRAFT_503325 [Xylariaceae sp. FL1272]|nr:hypothetical protein GGR57DRAFT_503325 [Xylariaceae sp. FL1272]